ncbi:MAG TPA: hypothetical protein VE779_06995 [Candidatus Angelobacter sp.]|jgi:uncharacterized membrane protein|nr:hypothetical protein [Candidatus Angelobacter sp.]
MTTSIDWIVVAGFLLAVTGLALRVVIMMRSSDTRAGSKPPLVGGDLVRAYRTANPASWLPRIMWASICVGLILLIAGFLLEFR